jgi:TonB-linked SusC/RagA family outer membrane protein
VATPVTVSVKEESIQNLLKFVFTGQRISYTIRDQYIILKLTPQGIPKNLSHELRGRVMNEEGLPLAGITVTVKGTNRSVITDMTGEFFLDNIEPGTILIFSGAETLLKELKVDNQTRLTVTVSTRISELDQVVLIPYGTTTRKLNTGNITKVSSAEIERNPVSNPLAALQGRVPGMIISQTSGLPGAAFKVQIRGRSSLDLLYSRNDPLFIIDGVPFEPGNTSSNQISNATTTPNNATQGGLSPLNNINPADIESIEVLKDADATAIYGSRGANGVILITTKKGHSGKLSLTANLTAGFSKVTRTLDMLNTQQYLMMRREAFANDGVTPTASNAPDLLLWDTTRYTDYKKQFQGGTAHQNNLQLAASGGNSTTQFRMGMGYNNQTNIFDKDLSDKIISGHFSINHSTDDGRVKLFFSGGYSSDQNKLIREDLTQYKNLPPHVQLKDDNGHLKWSEGGVDYTSLFGNVGNPLAILLKKYQSENENLMANFTASYRLVKDLTVKINVGYNAFSSDEVSVSPKSSISPSSSSQALSVFANSTSKSWIIEPQAEYKIQLGPSKLTVLAGGTMQERKYKSEYMTASNYSSDDLLYSLNAAGTITARNDYQLYRYMAVFGRLSYNWSDKYLLNGSYRVDGSSRFGPHKRFALFGAMGAGWIFSKENFFEGASKLLSYGKIRASYGVTGNDQIGNYKYLDLWGSSPMTYQGFSAINPNNLFNPDYNWERNRKLEGALELGFFKDHLLISVAYYKNRSGNQLILYPLAAQAGFGGVVKNLPALVENAGWEGVISYKTKVHQLSYAGSLNFSMGRNKLISFPGLAATGYATTYREGYSLSSYRRYQFLGVNDTTGLYTFADLNQDGVVSSKDKDFIGNSDPRMYGGSQHELRWKHFELDVFFEFKVQPGDNYLARVSSDYPGRIWNQPVIVLKRWQQKGDQAPVQRFSQNLSGAVATANANLLQSDGTISDASYLRCKNVSLSYQFQQTAWSKMKIAQCRIFMLAQNLFILTGYQGSDPETQDFFVLPPLRTIVAGIKIDF